MTESSRAFIIGAKDQQTSESEQSFDQNEQVKLQGFKQMTCMASLDKLTKQNLKADGAWSVVFCHTDSDMIIDSEGIDDPISFIIKGARSLDE